MEVQSEAPERVDPLNLFPPEQREDASDLAYLGYLTDTVRFCGHVFGLETLRPYVKFAIGQALQPYRNTIKEPDAYAALHVGMALTSVDGRTDFCPPIGTQLGEIIEARLRWLTEETGWLQPTIDFLADRYVQLEQRAAQEVAELHRLSEGSRDPSQPSPASSIDSGLSDAPTSAASPPSEASS